ncbi:hypothetical protein [Dendronalium sp. ChiSLP03b]|uniref:hypothetical protein n=1 Tax=Dendronalium sp. ChiSLP03b TaxID=3075381 RepID=UPI003919D63D
MVAQVVSSFEILVKPIAPSPPFAAAPSRTVVQAYFLLISNLNTQGPEVALSLKFVSGGTGLSSDKLITLLDTGVGNNFGKLGTDGKADDDIVLPSGFTGLFILQPDLRKPDVLPPPPAVPDLEIRGYVEIDISPNSSTSKANLLVTPQIRGTFLSDSVPPDFDQQSYCLPTPTGGALIEFN